MPANSKSVLITGCSAGGIGDALAQSFYARGHQVFATARSLDKIEHLKKLGLEVLELDVVNVESIEKCVEEVSQKTGGQLDVLVNNAGVVYSMPLLDANIGDSKKLFDVNFFSVLSTTQAFSPLLIASKGRVLNISSIASFTPVPFMGIYNCSKAALAMMSDVLRMELKPFGVDVVEVVTGGITTNIIANQAISPLPPNSIYNANKEEIEECMNGKVALKYSSGVHEYAEKVVKEALKARADARIFKGENSTTMWAVDTFGWHGLWNLIFPRIYGITNLTKKLKFAQAKTA